MSWNATVNITGTPQGSFRSLAGYASESLAIGRAMICGYIIFVKAWRDSKYDAVLDANGSLFRIEIKGTGGSTTISTSSGGRTGQQINRGAGSRERPLSNADCDWLIATTSMDGACWIIPTEIIDILQVKSISIKNVAMCKEKWGVFIIDNPNIKPYLKCGFRQADYATLCVIAHNLGIDPTTLPLVYRLDSTSTRATKYHLNQKDRLIMEIWESVYRITP